MEQVRQEGGRIIDNLQIDNLTKNFFTRIFWYVQYSTMADFLYSIMFSRASYSGILF